MGLKVGIAMSGGVDSSVAAALLKEQQAEVHGFFMILPLVDREIQEQRVHAVAKSLAIPLHVVTLQAAFHERVIRPFVESYRLGITPNPCILCNQAIKFGLLAEHILRCGMDRVATGHYVRTRQMHGQWYVARGVDRSKDQSYFLARVPAARIAHSLFPLGEWTKAQTRRRAETLGLECNGNESQDVCFLSSGLAEFLAEQGLGEQPGFLLDRDGRQLGVHQGCWRYTIGQRRGLGLPDATPWYVTALDGPGNRVIVGKEPDLLRRECAIHDLRWTGLPPVAPWSGLVQLRSRHQPAAAVVEAEGSSRGRIFFDRPQRAITPGQFAVFYQDDRVVGSAIISPPATNTMESQA